MAYKPESLVRVKLVMYRLVIYTFIGNAKKLQNLSILSEDIKGKILIIIFRRNTVSANAKRMTKSLKSRTNRKRP
jgi:hypothetical protein